VPSRSCVVSFTDSEGIEHSVRVSAASLYEAAVLALAEFRRHGFADTTFGPATNLNVQVKAPEAAHVVFSGEGGGCGKPTGNCTSSIRLRFRCILLTGSVSGLREESK
jgi:hypothetical protein